MINISPSLVNKLNTACPKQIYYEKIERIKTEPSELMLKGRYFEHHLIGGTVDGEIPELPKLKNGSKSADEKALDELLIFAKEVLNANGIDFESGQKQVRFEHDGMSGVVDYIGLDFLNKDRMALYDLKYTETKEDDRWNGWGDIEYKPDAKFQAIHYIRLAYEEFKVWMPYYFVIFGKSKWVKVIKIVATESSIANHSVAVNASKQRLIELEASGWKPTPILQKCIKCPFNSICSDKSLKSEVEVVEL